jgi:hypothetical protein
VAEQRQAGVGSRIDFECHPHVAIAAGRRHQLRHSCRGAGQKPRPHVDDQIRFADSVEDRAERRGLLEAADDGDAQPRVIEAQKRWGRVFGGRRRREDDEGCGGRQRATRTRESKGSVHDESPVRPQLGAARRTSVRERRRHGRE